MWGKTSALVSYSYSRNGTANVHLLTGCWKSMRSFGRVVRKRLGLQAMVEKGAAVTCQRASLPLTLIIPCLAAGYKVKVGLT